MYIDIGLCNLIKMAVLKNIEKFLKISSEELSIRRLQDLMKNYHGNELEEQLLKNLAGWNGDRGGEQVPEEFKVNADDEKL